MSTVYDDASLRRQRRRRRLRSRDGRIPLSGWSFTGWSMRELNGTVASNSGRFKLTADRLQMDYRHQHTGAISGETRYFDIGQ